MISRLLATTFFVQFSRCLQSASDSFNLNELSAEAEAEMAALEASQAKANTGECAANDQFQQPNNCGTGCPQVFSYYCGGFCCKDPKPECKTNQVLVGDECGCPEGLEPNPDVGKGRPLGTTHYIFALDDSGSMDGPNVSGSNWNGMFGAMTAFLTAIVSDEESKQNSKISVTEYNSNSRIVFTEQDPSMDLLDQIVWQSGGTDFTGPMMNIIKFMDDSIGNYDEYKIFFMTDGVAGYPEDQINELAGKSYVNDFIFETVSFPGYSDVLERMAKAFPNGTYYTTGDASEFAKHFQKFAPPSNLDCICPEGQRFDIDGNCVNF